MKYDSLKLVGGNVDHVQLPLGAIGNIPGSLGVNVSGNSIDVRTISGDVESISLIAADLYPFTSFAFLGRVRPFNSRYPTIDQLLAVNPTLDQQAFYADHYQVDNGKQLLKVPKTGRYTIALRGGQFYSTTKPAWGAYISIEVDLLRDDTLTIIVGDNASWGGAGASCVISETYGLLAIAGGSGGVIQAGDLTANQVLTASASYDLLAPGLGGGGAGYGIVANNNIYGGGGAGWTGNGSLLNAPAAAVPSSSLSTTASGGYDSAQFASFGGGGCGPTTYGENIGWASGGGGGYTGGKAGGNSASATPLYMPLGQGGTSYVRNIPQIKSSASGPSNVRATSGSVTITAK